MAKYGGGPWPGWHGPRPPRPGGDDRAAGVAHLPDPSPRRGRPVGHGLLGNGHERSRPTSPSARHSASTVALEHFDLGVRDGELISLLGPSGCGKTTALRIAAGFEFADTRRRDGRRRRHLPHAGPQAEHGHGVPELQPVPEPERGARTSTSACGPARSPMPSGPAASPRRSSWCSCRRSPSATRTSCRAGSSSASRWPGRSPCEPAGAAARRTAVGARRQGPHDPARRDPADPDRGRHHDPVRHPRPGGSAGDLRSGRRHVARTAGAARHAPRGVPPSSRAPSSPVSSAR